MAKATIRETGEVPVVSGEDMPFVYHFALVLTFDNPQDLRNAIAAGAAVFDWPVPKEGSDNDE